MKLTDAHIEEFYKFFFPLETAEQIAAKAKSLRDRLQAGTDSLETRFTCFHSGALCAIGSYSRLQNQVYGLTAKMNPGHAVDGLTPILKDVIGALRSQSARKLHYRAVVGGEHAHACEVLATFGFKKLNERVEYRSELSSLPSEEGTPLSWKPMADKTDASLQHHAKLLEAGGQGDPDWSPDDNAFELLKEYLSDSSLNGSASCVQVGHLRETPAAIVVAQVNPTSAWSRITYMGILPEFRGKGLGRWVHRHGFSMMREQGGDLYHGGTLVTNTPMRKLFESSGCREFQRLEEWVLEF